jgi:hypothetical protein
MGLSIYNIKKWTKMLMGKSLMHVNQDMGKHFVPGELKGYFNNLTEKVLKDPDTLNYKCVPITTDEKAGEVYFPIAIFQYGLGAYDLYLETKNIIYYDQFARCVEWAMLNQEESGSWNNFGFIQPDAPYSSMCQGEGVSLLLRAYVNDRNEEALRRAKKAIDFMLLPIEAGGTAKYDKDSLYLYEYTNKPCILNGWIFSLFGLYDFIIVTDKNEYKEVLEKTLNTLNRSISQFDNGFWSMYDFNGMIASPFYHNLHIAQLEALYLTFDHQIYKQYCDKFTEYGKNPINKVKAFVLKAIQKIMER